MTGQQYLNTLIRMKDNIKFMTEKKNEIMEQAASAGGIDLSRERVQVSHTYDKIGKQVVEVAELSERIKQEQNRYLEKENEMIEKIRQLHDSNYVSVLYKIYVQQKSFDRFDRVAEETEHTLFWVNKWHDKAVKSFQMNHTEIRRSTRR